MSQIERKARSCQIYQSCSWISESLFELMKEYSYHTITVTQIVKKAGVSRQTFYRYFKRSDDVILWQIDQLFEGYLERLRAILGYTLREDLILMFTIMREESVFLMQLFKHHLECLLLERLTKYARYLEGVYEHTSDRDLVYISEYFAGGIFMVAFKWLKDGMPETEEKLVKMIIERCFSNNFDTMIRQPIGVVSTSFLE